MRVGANLKIWLFLTVFLPAIVSPATGKIIFADADAIGDNDGSSWTDAYNYLQGALADANSAAKPVQIRVAQGIYKPDQGGGNTPGDREATFQLIDGVTLKGGFAGVGERSPNARDINLYKTVLSGDLNGNDVDVNDPSELHYGSTRIENSYHVVTGSRSNETAVLDGFLITCGNANGPYPHNRGGGIYNADSTTTVLNCTFTSNSANHGGGMYNNKPSSPTLTNCTFTRNFAKWHGGGLYNGTWCHPKLSNCTFSANLALGGSGGGIFHSGGTLYIKGSMTLDNCSFLGNSAKYHGGGVSTSLNCSATLSNCTFVANTAALNGGGFSDGSLCNSVLINCAFEENSAAEYGGAIYLHSKNPALARCTFRRNSANEGGAIFSDHSNLTIEYCILSGNSADYGGAIENCHVTKTILTNCVFSGNSANLQGGTLYNFHSRPTLTNCTFAGNSAQNGNALACDSYEQKDPSSVEIINCILWDDGNEIWNNDGSTITISYSDINGGWLGKYNININPRFVDADGADNVFGTEDDSLRLHASSPCIDMGNTLVVPPSMFKDLDGYLRIMNYVVDMGAYEFGSQLGLFVDAVNGNDDNDGLTPESAFATIQKGIETAQVGNIVLVYPGVYQEEVNFLGKSITVKSAAEPAVLENPDDYAVSFYHMERSTSVLSNFIIRNSYMGIFIVGSSPTIRNVTVVNNRYGIKVYDGSQPDICSSIFWNNVSSDFLGHWARYSRIEQRWVDESNIDANPLFVDLGAGDYHLLSERGRYWPEHNVWVIDKVTSPCIDGGDPTANPSGEPMPNGGRINMGAYGGTGYASMSEMWWLDGDINHDGVVNMIDLAILAENWLEDSTPIPPVPPPKGRACFVDDTPVWVDGALVQISKAVSGQMVGKTYCEPAMPCLEKIEKVQEHEGTFECRDIVLEGGNRISVVDAHCFMLDSGQWIAAQNLTSGLRLKTLNGTVAIKSVAIRAVPFVGKVYNLKIKGADRYLVGEDGLIVRDY